MEGKAWAELGQQTKLVLETRQGEAEQEKGHRPREVIWAKRPRDLCSQNSWVI